MNKNNGFIPWLLVAILVASSLAWSAPSRAAGDEDPLVLGIMLSVGGRYDDVRMCVGSPPGVKGGPAMDVSFFADVPIDPDRHVIVNIPVVRPILFAFASRMLQFEPEVTLSFRRIQGDRAELWMGPTLGITFHYGPDYESARSGSDRGPSFFAVGPKFGGTFGVRFLRPGKTFDFQLALTPYVTTLYSLGQEQGRDGVVIGGNLSGLFRFSTGGGDS